MPRKNPVSKSVSGKSMRWGGQLQSLSFSNQLSASGEPAPVESLMLSSTEPGFAQGTDKKPTSRRGVEVESSGKQQNRADRLVVWNVSLQGGGRETDFLRCSVG